MQISPFSPQTFWIEGFSAVSEYLKWKPSAVVEIFCLPKEQGSIKRLLAELGLHVPVSIRDEKSEGSPIRESSFRESRKPGRGAAKPSDRGNTSIRPRRGQESDKDGQRHQVMPAAPVVAKVTHCAIPAGDWLHGLVKTPESLVLALDHVQDPRNLGAILRSAAFFGVRTIVVPERRQVLLTQASVGTAQGGFALCNLVCTVNLTRTLRDLKDQGYWIIGATMDGEPVSQVAGQYDKVVLVLGAEDTGLSRMIDETCDRKVAIQGDGKLDSLNVSVAAGILLNAFTNSHLRS